MQHFIIQKFRNSKLEAQPSFRAQRGISLRLLVRRQALKIRRARRQTVAESRAMERAPCVYILASKSGVLYTGVTSNLAARVGQHKQGRVPGFTTTYNVNRLVWFEPHGNMFSAIAWEKEIKSWTRAKKVALIEAKNREWRDLAER
jgi:putative endonuclease